MIFTETGPKGETDQEKAGMILCVSCCFQQPLLFLKCFCFLVLKPFVDDNLMSESTAGLERSVGMQVSLCIIPFSIQTKEPTKRLD